MPSVSPAAGLTGVGLVLAPIAQPGAEASYLPVGSALTDATQLQVLRVSVLVANAGHDPVTWTPRVEFRRVGDPVFTPVPEQYTPGVAFRTSIEWLDVAGGTDPAPAVTALSRTHQAAPVGLAAVAGRRASGPNPDSPRPCLRGAPSSRSSPSPSGSRPSSG